MRPCVSVSGTRWTRCAPDSNLSLEYAPWPTILRDDLAIAAEVGRALRDHLDLPAVALGEARIHAEEVGGEKRRLLAAGARADLEENVALVVRVFRQQLLLQLDFDLLEALARLAHLGFRELAARRVLRHLLRRCVRSPSALR